MDRLSYLGLHMDRLSYLGLHILNRVYARLSRNITENLDAMRVVEETQHFLIDTVEPAMEPAVIVLLGDINLWIDWHEVPEAE